MRDSQRREPLDVVGAVLREYAEQLGLPMRLEVLRSPEIWPRGRAEACLWLHPLAVPFRSGWLRRTPRFPTRTLPSVGCVPLPPGRQGAWAAEWVGRGQVLEDDAAHAVGLLSDTQVYPLFDLLGQEASRARALTRTLLDLALAAALPLFSLLAGVNPAAFGDRAGRLRQDTEAEVLGSPVVSSAFDHSHAGTSPEELGELAHSRRALGQRLAAMERRLLTAERRCAELEQQQAEPELLAREVDRIAALPGVVEVRVVGEAVLVYTGMVTAQHEARVFRLGRFRMELGLDGRIAVHNLTDRRGGYDHPHVEGGRPCLGNLERWLQQLLARREVAAATTLLLEYLRTINASDWRRPVRCWPEVAAGKTEPTLAQPPRRTRESPPAVLPYLLQ